MQDSLPNLTTMHTFSLSTSKNRYLGWRTASGRNELAIAEREYLWMFLPPSQALPPPN